MNPLFFACENFEVAFSGDEGEIILFTFDISDVPSLEKDPVDPSALFFDVEKSGLLAEFGVSHAVLFSPLPQEVLEQVFIRRRAWVCALNEAGVVCAADLEIQGLPDPLVQTQVSPVSALSSESEPDVENLSDSSAALKHAATGT